MKDKQLFNYSNDYYNIIMGIPITIINVTIVIIHSVSGQYIHCNSDHKISYAWKFSRDEIFVDFDLKILKFCFIIILIGERACTLKIS